MDSLELNKIIAGVLGAVLALMLFTWVGDMVYGFYGHDDHHELAYEIELPEGDVVVAEAEVQPHISEFLVNASAENGEGLFRACSACHNSAEAANKVGPYLLNVMGREIGVAEGFGYSDALASMDDVWTAENFSGFIENPSGWAPGTSMGYNGMRDPEDRADIIAYLVSTAGQNIDDFIVMPAVEDAVVEEAAMVEEAAEEDAVLAVQGGEEETPEEPVTAEELVTGAEGGVSAADTDTASDIAAGAGDVSVTDAEIETVTGGAPDADTTPAVTEAESEAIAEQNAPPADTAESAAPGETAPVEADPVETVPTETAPAEEAPAEDAALAVPAFMASADAGAGERAFRACRACHVVDQGVNRTGPSLYAVVNRDIGAIEDYNYSSAMAEHGGQWTYENLNAYLEAPRSWLPGTKMGYAGMRSAEDRANVIAYLEAAAQ